MAGRYMTICRYGGKARMGSWVMGKIEEVAKRNNLHTLFDVFGGGGTISLAAVKITDDDESEVLADLTDILHPADNLDLLANMLHAELIAGVCTGLCHN